MNKIFFFLILLIPSLSAQAGDIATLFFKASSGQPYASEVLLPQKNGNNGYQVIYQSLNTSTLITEQKHTEKEPHELITKWVTHGVYIKAKALDPENGLYKFHIEYTGVPEVRVDNEEKKAIVIDSGDDITYEVKLALKEDFQSCSEFSVGSDKEVSSGSKFCISLQ